MKAYVPATCLVGFGAFCLVSGQSLAGLPECAKPCAANLPAECGRTDFKCICGSSDWISGISCCVLKACSPADQQKTIDTAKGYCSIVGITLPSVASCPSSTVAAPASTPTTTPKSTSSSGSAGSAASKQSSSSSVNVIQNSATTENSATTTTGSTVSSTTSDQSNTSATAVSTGVAGRLGGQGIGAAGAAALALALI